MTNDEQVFADLTLARRLERAEARANARFVEARARAFPEVGAAWIEVAGAYAMYDGLDSPCTQTFGLGVFDDPTQAHLDQLESFFKQRGANVFHEVSPLAHSSLFELLNARGYRPIEFTSVMFRPIKTTNVFVKERNPNITVRRTTSSENELWARTTAEGWSEMPELSDFLLDISKVNAQNPDSLSFLAELNGMPIATGAMGIHNNVAILAGACTIPRARKQGAQLALLNRRLTFAAENGCDLAMMCTAPGSASQRNAERQGFRIAYTRIKWQLVNS